METKINFSSRRMVQVLLHDFAEDKRRNLLCLVAFFGLLLVSMFFILFLFRHDSFHEFEAMFFVFYLGMLTWGSYFAGAEIMRPLRTKAGRIAYLTLPATKSEKFVARLLYVTVGYLGVAIVSLLAVDAIYQLLVAAMSLGNDFHQSLTAATFDVGNQLIVVDDRHLLVSAAPLLTFVFVAGYFCNQAFWIVGGCLWYKNAFIKTLAAQMILSTLLMFGIFAVLAVWSNLGIEPQISDDFMFKFLAYGSAISIVLTFVFYWLSYWFFTKAQVVSRNLFFFR